VSNSVDSGGDIYAEITIEKERWRRSEAIIKRDEENNWGHLTPALRRKLSILAPFMHLCDTRYSSEKAYPTPICLAPKTPAQFLYIVSWVEKVRDGF